jgi:DNA polymerase III delta prime subunit
MTTTNEHIKKFDTHFHEYTDNNEACSLHPKMMSFYNTFPESLHQLKNMMFYGPSGVGKYTQVLQSIKKYSPSKLKYEKKISITFNKNTYYFRISDVHYEIDMSLLGCNSKLLWNELYNQIIDIIHTKSDKSGIIVCKNFHNINSELLDTFYSYMQKTPVIRVTFIIVTENMSFIPDNITNCCRIIRISRPSRTLYNKCLGNTVGTDIELEKITNMKNMIGSITQLMNPHETICNKLLNSILDINNMSFQNVRNQLYDIFIYNLDVTDCIWYIVERLVVLKHIKNDDMRDVMKKLYSCLQYFNNNYRPIYHLESFIFYLVKKVHGF